MGGFPGLNPHLDAEHAELVVYVGVNPVVSHGHTSAMPDPVTAIRALRDASGRLGRRSPSHRDRSAGHPPPRAATRAPTTRSSRSWCASCCATAPTARCSSTTRSGSDALAARGRTVHPRARGARSPTSRAADLTELLDAVRRAGRVAVVTGTGVTMSASANVTQWLAWALMILTGSMNRPGGVWFHPGFRHQLESFELPISPPDGLFGPGPAHPSRSRGRSSANGRAPCSPTRSAPATSAPC